MDIVMRVRGYVGTQKRRALGPPFSFLGMPLAGVPEGVVFSFQYWGIFFSIAMARIQLLIPIYIKKIIKS